MVLADASLVEDVSCSPVFSAGSVANAAGVFVLAVQIKVGGAVVQPGQNSCPAARRADGPRRRRTSGNRVGRKSGKGSCLRHNRRQRNRRQARTAPAAQLVTDQQARLVLPSRGAGEADGSMTDRKSVV